MKRPARTTVHALVVLMIAGLAGCETPPLRRSTIEDESLLTILDAFDEVVLAARNDEDYAWYSGWIGNLWVNFWGDENLGLCYHWQEWVYQELQATIESVGWDSCGVAVNLNSEHEHHAVVVFDPRTARHDQLLEDLEGNPSWVLDAWRRGRPDVYTMADWLTLPAKIAVPAELEELPWHEDLNLPFRASDWDD